ncbi:MAG: hypothetical protein IT423_06275 [Pirellulaceae bacterium]|nr:hypothetical protein [Pirellulaceae bacterium]
MSLKECLPCDSLAAPQASKSKKERLAQGLWILVLVGPLPLVFYPFLENGTHVSSLAVRTFGIVLWCVALFAFVALVRSRWDKVTRHPETWTSWIMLASGMVCYFLSILSTFSILSVPAWAISIATLGWLLLAAAWLATHTGLRESGSAKMFIYWPALCMLQQLPEFLETRFLLAYKQLLFTVTAGCFDALSIPFHSDHLSFQFAKASLAIDEVLSNSHMIAWMLFVSCLIVAWLRRPLVLLPAYLCIALFWTFGMHWMQLLVLGVARQQDQLAFSNSGLSILLMAVTLVLAVALLFSSDRCLRILFMPVELEDSWQGQLNPINRLWNRLLGTWTCPRA